MSFLVIRAIALVYLQDKQQNTACRQDPVLRYHKLNGNTVSLLQDSGQLCQIVHMPKGTSTSIENNTLTLMI